jgi:hypothetical protein
MADPVAVEVELEDGIPVTVTEGSARPRRVDRVCACWRVEADWWRVPVAREYWKLLLREGLSETLSEVYLDRLTGRWWLSRVYD